MSGTHQYPSAPLVVTSGKLKVDVTESITETMLTAGTDTVTELMLTMEDPGWERMKIGLYSVGNARVVYGAFDLTLAAVEVNGGASGHGGIRAQFRSTAVRKLKRRRGALSMRNASASDFVKAECQAVGLKVFTQDSPKRLQIARDVPKEGEPVQEGAEYPSSWTTFQRLAREQGFLMFEYAGFMHFGSPSWCMNKFTTRPKVHWINGPDELRPLTAPVTRRSEDAKIPVEMSFDVPWGRLSEFIPGRAVEVDGMPLFNGRYIINNVSFDLQAAKAVSVSCGTAINPTPTKEGEDNSVTERGVGPHKHIVDAARDAGFTGENLIIAVAVALAESGGDPRAVSPPNTVGKAAGSRDHGLWQINDYYHSFDKVLIYNAEYNAKQAFRIFTAGPPRNSWNPWSTYRNGAYRKWMETARSAVEVSTSVALRPDVDTGNARPGPHAGVNINASGYPSLRGWGGPGGLSGRELARVDVPGIALNVRREVAPLFRELIRLLRANGHDHLTSSGGYSPRYIAGTTTWSNHAWGLAVDLDAAHNPYRRGVLITDMPKNSSAIAASLGMRWGGDYKNVKDAMHFEFMGSPQDAARIIREKNLG